MEKIHTLIPEVFIIKPDVFGDSRGFFFESYSEKKYKDLGINYNFVQDNISKSVKGVLRGLHYQIGESAQGKLVQVISGSVLDVAVDVRFGSPTFGQHVAVELTGENHLQLWIPPGFAHGFSVLSDEVIFQYKCTQLYSKPDERCIIYNDSNLNIDWKIENPVVSEKDLVGLKFTEINEDFVYKK